MNDDSRCRSESDDSRSVEVNRFSVILSSFLLIYFVTKTIFQFAACHSVNRRKLVRIKSAYKSDRNAYEAIQKVYCFLETQKCSIFDRKMSLKLSVLIFLVISISLVLCETEKPIEKGYETKYDNIDLDEILKNDRLRKNYVKCLVNEGPCTPDGQELKSNKHSHKRHTKCDKKSKSNHNLTLHKFFDRLATRRNRDQLFKMYGKTEGRFNESDTLSY